MIPLLVLFFAFALVDLTFWKGQDSTTYNMARWFRGINDMSTHALNALLSYKHVKGIQMAYGSKLLC